MTVNELKQYLNNFDNNTDVYYLNRETGEIISLISDYNFIADNYNKEEEKENIVEQFNDFFKEEEPTEKQISYAQKIGYELGEPLPREFTKNAYREFISKHVDEFKRKTAKSYTYNSRQRYYSYDTEPYDDTSLDYFGWYDIY